MKRIACAGPADGEPCHVHAWFYVAPRGRHRVRCPVCIRERKNRRQREDYAAMRDVLGKDAWNVKADRGVA